MEGEGTGPTCRDTPALSSDAPDGIRSRIGRGARFWDSMRPRIDASKTRRGSRSLPRMGGQLPERPATLNSSRHPRTRSPVDGLDVGLAEGRGVNRARAARVPGLRRATPGLLLLAVFRDVPLEDQATDQSLCHPAADCPLWTPRYPTSGCLVNLYKRSTFDVRAPIASAQSSGLMRIRYQVESRTLRLILVTRCSSPPAARMCGSY
jgi:hypothetical protein